MEVLCRALNCALARGASYAEVRRVRQVQESITVKNGLPEKLERGSDAGLSVRLLKDGAWGFAATHLLTLPGAEKVASLATDISQASAALRMVPISLSPQEPLKASWQGPCVVDPFSVSREEKIELLICCCQLMAEEEGVKLTRGTLDFIRTDEELLTSDGTHINQTIFLTGAGIQATAIAGGEVQQRSYPSSFRGSWSTAGYEFITSLDLLGNASRVAQEVARLLKAPPCPATETDLILEGDQLALQIHESIGHPLELDRILGMELSYAGGSFVHLEDRGRLRYGSPLLNVVGDATLAGGAGSFGYDHEGVPAQRTWLIKEGILQGFMTSRETASALNLPSSGAARAADWRRIPLVRMTNVNLLPQEGTLAELIARTEEGIFMATNRSWSIDDRRLNFQFGCEMAYRVNRGKLKEIYKNPIYRGITPSFWASLDAVTGSEECRLWGTASCGKGQPPQAIAVGHACPQARFKGVQVGTG